MTKQVPHIQVGCAVRRARSRAEAAVRLRRMRKLGKLTRVAYPRSRSNHVSYSIRVDVARYTVLTYHPVTK